MKSIYDEYRPRNEEELCSLFEDLLFLRVKDFSPELEEESSEHRLSNKDIAFLNKNGILNRIFRRWSQTTFGYEGLSKHFGGETPRQELARIRPGLNEGKEYFSVNLEKVREEWKVIPHYFSSEFLKKEGGVFRYGLKNLAKSKNSSLVEPQLDIGFKTFVYLLKKVEKSKNGTRKKTDFENDFAKYWNLFLEMGASQVVLNCGIKFDKGEFNNVAKKFYNCLIYYFKQQSYGEDNYLSMDGIIFALWNVLRESNKNLPSFEEVADIKLKAEKMKKDPQFKKAVEVFYRLSKAFDAYILFPIDRYFGLAEIVWTDKGSFFEDLGITFHLLKNNLKVENSREENGDKYLDVNDIALDLKYIWFCPCRSFRMIGSAFQYFH